MATSPSDVTSRLHQLLSDRTRFRRAPQPWPRGVEVALLGAWVTNQPLRFFAEWGLGETACFGTEDRDAMLHLRHVASVVAACCGVEWSLELLMTDTHARINGVTAASAAQYGNAVEREAARSGVVVRWMSLILDQATSRPWQEVLNAWEEGETLWSSRSEWTRQELRRRASRCGNKQSPDQSARQYVRMSHLESVILPSIMSGGILITYQTPTFAFLLPPVPTIFAFVGPGRLMQRPWFLRRTVEPGPQP